MYDRLFNFLIFNIYDFLPINKIIELKLKLKLNQN